MTGAASNVIAPHRLEEVALQLADRGMRLFPVRRDGTKRPAHKGWQIEATTDGAQIRRWIDDGYNLAIATEHYGNGQAIVEIDVDVRDGKPGARSLQNLQMLYDDLPPTLTVETPTGGRHFAYAVDKALRSDTRGRLLGPGIDVKSRGGYVLAPGSVLNGGAYRILEDRPIAPAPQWLVDLIGVAPPKAERMCEVLPGVNPERAQGRAIEYLVNRAPLAIEGSGGNRTTYDVATILGDYGVDEDSALALMLEHWNGRCSPPWLPDELAEPVGNAYQYREEPIGSQAPEAEFEPYIHDGPVPYASLLRQEPAPVQELVPGLVERNIVTFIDGPGGTHKSRVAMQIGLSIDAGAAVWGRPTARAKFVHLSSEDDVSEIIRRAHAITRCLNLPDTPAAAFWDRKDKDSALARVKEGGEIELLPFHAQLVEYLRSIHGHKFVVVDSLYDYIRYVGGARIDEDSVNAFIKRTLGALCTETDSSMLVIRHPSRAGMERGDMTSYSVANENAPRARLSLRAGDGDSYVLKVEKRNHGPKGEEITLYWNDGAMIPLDQMQTADQGSKLSTAVATAAIEAATDDRNPMTMQAHPTARQMKRIAELAGRRPSPKEIKEELSHACRAGGPLTYIFADGKHRAGYFPVEGAEFLSRQLKKSGANPGANRVQTAGADWVQTACRLGAEGGARGP